MTLSAYGTGARSRRRAQVPARSRAEPVEIERPENEALDRIERDIDAVLAAGGEAALVARLRRIMPNLNGAKP